MGNGDSEQLFVRTIHACVVAGLVEGKKIHIDGSLVRAHASTDSVVAGPPELIAALRQAYQDQAAKLAEPVAVPAAPLGPANQTHLSLTDPDSELARGRTAPCRPSYKLHRVADNAYGVITAQMTTAGSVKEDTRLFELVEQHERHTTSAVDTVIADSQYGTVENFLGCVDRGIRPHMADLKTAQHQGGLRTKFFGEEQFHYDAASDTYRCPAGQLLKRWQRRAEKRAYQYLPKAGTCAACALRAQCTKAKGGRRIQRFDRQRELDQARVQSQTRAARRDRQRRKHLMEGSFADAANCHGYKRARWRRLWRQQIQGHLIAACQNIRILLRDHRPLRKRAISTLIPQFFPLKTRPSCRA